MRANRNICGGFLLVLAAWTANLQAREVMSWAPPYDLSDTQAILQSNFGDYSPSNGLNRLALQFWIPTATGGVIKTPYYDIFDSDITWYKNWGTSNDCEVLLCIFNNVGVYPNGHWDWDLARNAFSSNRTVFVSNLVAVMNAHNLDGIDIDFEGTNNLSAGDRPAFKLFLEELSAELVPLGKVLTVDSFHSPLYNAPNMSWWVDWTNLVDNIHSVGYTNLYEGSTQTLWSIDGYLFRYSWQQNYGVSNAGLAPEVVSMGLLSETAYWGEGGRGSNVLDHINECIYDCAVPASVCFWDIQLDGTSGTPNWRSSEVWEALTRLSKYESIPVDLDGDNMSDEWEIAHLGGTNAVDGAFWEDKDQDGYTNLEEYLAGTNPTNNTSRLRVDIHGSVTNVVVSHPASGVDPFDVHYGDQQRSFWLETASSLPDSDWTPVPGSSNLVQGESVFTFTNATPPPGEWIFYRANASLAP